MKGHIFLTQKEARRSQIIRQLIDGAITVDQAAQLLSLSTRQVKRLKKGVVMHGPASLAHRNRGRKPPHTIPDDLRRLIVALASDPDEYRGTSCEHMAELLAQNEGFKVSPRSIRRILTSAGVTSVCSHKVRRRRRSRDRMPAFGMLVQCDSSPYAWFESRASKACLNELAGISTPLTQLGHVLSDLGINHVPAGSPQAKGRIERLWETLQTRLVVELRLAHISDIDSANYYLAYLIAKFNRRFSVEPAQQESAFRPCPPRDTLYRIVCTREPRKASSGSTISFHNKTYHLVTDTGSVAMLRPKAQVLVLTHIDGSISALYDGKPYLLNECTPKPKLSAKPKQAQPKPYKPPANHPWRHVDPNRALTYEYQDMETFWKGIYAER